jgi:hypothetical protein
MSKIALEEHFVTPDVIAKVSGDRRILLASGRWMRTGCRPR